ncbi:hypothetical protein ADIARSV_3298 [Arcticibacter svalbardensis MN12-7]|uniref:Uncharacterized protein n=1 Tax=Arcticibacter svalbardensis MN12-7 TaxID=1150600 RepID=R9GPX9_9SPHI|nr:hypothetical protein [Arcticibacter svalbardensis]EOR93585.1 hypothetical protein ADIARSV_3298 [Arcticibacter svalbardensis MN12-7]
MGYAKERGKLEKLVIKIAGIAAYDEKSMAVLIDIHENYSHTIRILKNKQPDSFGDLYKNELQEINQAKKAVKEANSDEIRQSNFVLYKDTLVRVLEKTIQIAKAIL